MLRKHMVLVPYNHSLKLYSLMCKAMDSAKKEKFKNQALLIKMKVLFFTEGLLFPYLRVK